MRRELKGLKGDRRERGWTRPWGEKRRKLGQCVAGSVLVQFVRCWECYTYVCEMLECSSYVCEMLGVL